MLLATIAIIIYTLYIIAIFIFFNSYSFQDHCNLYTHFIRTVGIIVLLQSYIQDATCVPMYDKII